MKEYENEVINNSRNKPESNCLITVETRQYSKNPVRFKESSEDDFILNGIDGLDDEDVTGSEIGDSYKLLSEAYLSEENGRLSICYDESRLTGLEGTSTMVSFSLEDPTVVSVTRSGAVRTALVIEKGVRHFCTYETPFANFEICTFGIDTENNMTETGGTIVLNYLIEFRGTLIQHTVLTLRAKTKEKEKYHV